MAEIKIIPCLDCKDGRVVKGVNFVNFRDAGDPAELAAWYCGQGADELVLLDITATAEKRRTMAELVRRVSPAVTVPFTVGGGIASMEDAGLVLAAGADKISVNSAAVRNPDLLSQLSELFGSARLVAAIDARTKADGGFEVLVNGGARGTGLDAVAWAKECEARGAGEILLTALDADGTRDGYNLPLTRAVAQAVAIPVTASGGAGKLEHFYQAYEIGCRGALAASLFHFGELTIPGVKEYLRGRGVDL